MGPCVGSAPDGAQNGYGGGREGGRIVQGELGFVGQQYLKLVFFLNLYIKD